MIKDVLNGDMTRFLMVFNVDYSETKKSKTWVLQATPKLSAVADFLGSITMTGNLTDLKQMVIMYKNGTIITIDFKRMNTESPDEIKC
jgi:hypothetical protein